VLPPLQGATRSAADQSELLRVSACLAILTVLVVANFRHDGSALMPAIRPRVGSDLRGVSTLADHGSFIYDIHIARISFWELMRVAKWGNCLAVRLPDAVVKALKLKTGDEIEIVASGTRRFEVGRDRSRERALERLRTLKMPLPKGFRFDRDEANAR
jgi:antitoxin MazE